MEIASILSSSQITTLASLLAANRQQDDQSTDLASMLLSENDTDGDGLMSQAELDSMLQQNAFMGELQSQMSSSGEGPEAHMASDLISAYDIDGDGSLNASELGMTDDELAAYDIDGDGLLNSEELVSGLEADKEAMMAESSSSLLPPGETNDLFNQILSGLDSDGDGSLNASELGSGSLLSSLDTDGDGTVSSDELIAGLSSQSVTTLLEATDSSSSSSSSTVASSDSSSDSSDDSDSDSIDPMDTNKDGVVSQTEYDTWMTEHGFTLGTDSADSGSDSSSRSLLARAMEAYANQSSEFLDMFSMSNQGLFSSSGLGLSASA